MQKPYVRGHEHCCSAVESLVGAHVRFEISADVHMGPKGGPMGAKGKGTKKGTQRKEPKGRRPYSLMDIHQ